MLIMLIDIWDCRRREGEKKLHSKSRFNVGEIVQHTTNCCLSLSLSCRSNIRVSSSAASRSVMLGNLPGEEPRLSDANNVARVYAT